MRLDKFLFFTRLTKTRSLAQKIINEGHVRVDGKAVATCHTSIAVGQVVTLPLYHQIIAFRVTALPSRRGPAPEAQASYDILTKFTD